MAKEVVNDEDVEKVIVQIEKPEVIEEQEQAFFFSEKLKNQELFLVRNNYSVIQKENLRWCF